MKRIISLLVLLLVVVGCQSKPDYSKVYPIETYDADMSEYEGLDSHDHMFLGTSVPELVKLIDEKGYGVFVLSTKYCAHCQIIMRYLNEVAKELNVKIFYLNGTSEEYPIQNSDNYDILENILYDHLKVGQDGPEIQTPHVFTIIDGKIKDSQVGSTWEGLEYKESDIEELKNVYRKMLTPFSKQSQD